MTATTDPQAAVDAFNRKYPVDTWVRYWRGVREGAPSGTGRIWAPAEVLGGHTPVVWIDGTTGGIALTHVEPVELQPDGIDEQGRELPDPVRGAERVREYLEVAGDGLYDVAGTKPLFARDLESICRAVLAGKASR